MENEESLRKSWRRKMGRIQQEEKKLKEWSLGLRNSPVSAFLPTKRKHFIFPGRRQNEQQGLLLWQEHLEMC